MNKAPFHKRRPLLCGFLVVLLVTVGMAALFLSQLDLEDYLQTFEEKLSEGLQQPVTIGQIHLTYEKGLALELHNLVIGEPATPLMRVPRLAATLKLKPLLGGRFILDQVLIDNPGLELWLPFQSRPERGSSQRLLDTFGIRILTMRNARLTIHHRQPEGSRQLLQLDNLYSVLTGWETGKTGRLILTGQYFQQQHASDFTLDLSLPADTDPASWRSENFHYQLTLQNLSTASLPRPAGAEIPQQVDLIATLDGVPADGATLKARLFSQSDQEELFKLDGTWQSTSEQDSVTGLNGTLLGLPIDGEFLLVRQEEKNFLGGRLGAKNIELSAQLLKQWRIPVADKLQKGKLDKLALVLEKSWQPEKETSGLPRIGLEVSLSKLAWSSPEFRQLQNFSVALNLENSRLQIKNGLAAVGSHPVQFSGQIDGLLQGPRGTLQLRFEPRLDLLQKQLTLPDDWRLSGPVPVTLQLSGALAEPNLVLLADLDTASLTLGRLLEKRPDQPAQLQLRGLLDKDYLQLDRFQVKLGDVVLSGEGNVPRKPNGEELLLDIDPFELAELHPYSPLLKQLQLVGQIHPYLEYTAADRTRGTLQLNNLGMHFFNVVGDLRQASGEVHFNRDGLSFANLEAQLGESPVRINGQLQSWQEPQLEVGIQGKQVRAVDLIFPNRELTFYDLDGTLRIDRQGMSFAPVHVRLEEETQATVTGRLENFKDPQVSLDITAEKANVLEVIRVFKGPRKRPRKDPQRELKPLLINVAAKQGTLGGLNFTNATGTIKDHRGVFTIYPLNFESDEGYCVARVEFDRNQKPGLLKVSGHAENINASVLHQNIFKKRGLISGKLRGDFYLEGHTEKDRFWHTAGGGIHLQVKDGTLRKFRGLARVFSLLNISQIFAGKLPDMDKDGMPFTLLEGSIRVANGRLRTEDLHVVSEAMNMSLVGDQSLVEDTLNLDLGVMPLRTVDKVVSNIPVAGWVLAGDKKALFTAHFKITGPTEAPKVTAVPVDSVSSTVFGIVKRTFGLPGKLVKDLGGLLQKEPEKKVAEPPAVAPAEP